MKTVDGLGCIHKHVRKDNVVEWRVMYWDNGKHKTVYNKSKEDAERTLYSLPHNAICLEKLINHCEKYGYKTTNLKNGDYVYDDLYYEVHTKRYRVSYHAIHENEETIVSEIKAFGPKGNMVFNYLYHGTPKEPVPMRKFKLLYNDLKEAMKC